MDLENASRAERLANLAIVAFASTTVSNDLVELELNNVKRASMLPLSNSLLVKLRGFSFRGGSNSRLPLK